MPFASYLPYTFIWYYDVLIALPMVIMGIDKFFDNDKWISGWFILAMLYIGIQGFYFLFWQCLIAGGYFIIKLLWTKGKVYVRIIKFGFNVLCSLLLIAPVLLPDICWFLASTRNTRGQYTLFELLPSMYELRTFLRSFLTPTANAWSHYLLTSVALFALVLFIINWKKHLFEALLLFFSILALITPGVGLLFNGGGYISDRGFYFVWFVLAYCVLCGLEDVFLFHKKSLIISILITLLYELAICVLEREFFIYHLMNMIFFIGIIFACWGTYLALKKSVYRFQMIMIILVFSISALCLRNISFVYNPDNDYQVDYATLCYLEQFVDLSSLREDEMRDYSMFIPQSDEWFRVETDRCFSQNEGVIQGFCPTHEYWSINNSWAQRFFKEIDGLPVSCLTGKHYHESMAVRSFLGVRYYERNNNIEYNDLALPVIIGYIDYVSEAELEDWTVEERQSILLKKIIIRDERADNHNTEGGISSYSEEDAKKDIAQRKLLLDSSTVMEDNGIKSDINMREDGYILFTIPYGKGWTAYMDGKKIPIFVADYGLIGMKVFHGQHEIRLVYHNPYRIFGWILFGLGMILLICLLNMRSVRRRQDGQLLCG